MDLKKLNSLATDLVNGESKKEKLEDRRKEIFSYMIEAEDTGQDKKLSELKKKLASHDVELDLARERILKTKADMLKEAELQLKAAIASNDADMKQLEKDFTEQEKIMCRLIGQAQTISIGLGHAETARSLGQLFRGHPGYESTGETRRLLSYVGEGRESGKDLVEPTDWHTRKSELKQIAFLKKTPTRIVDHVKKLTMTAVGRARRGEIGGVKNG